MQENAKKEVCKSLGDAQLVKQGKYLGLPKVITRSKEEVFESIKTRIQKKIEGWKEKLLNSAGKEVRLKSVIMARPTYEMSWFRLSRKLCKNIIVLWLNIGGGTLRKKNRI